MAKQCIVRRDEQGEVTGVVIPNPNHILNIAKARNNNVDLKYAGKEGTPSQLYTFFRNGMRMSEEAAQYAVAQVFTDEFGELFGRWWEPGASTSQVLDKNGQPKVVWSAQFAEDTPVTYKAYTRRTEDYRIDNDGFFLEDRAQAETYSFLRGMQGAIPTKLKDSLRRENSDAHLIPVFLNIRKMAYPDINSGEKITHLYREQDIDGTYARGQGILTNSYSVRDASQVIEITGLSQEQIFDYEDTPEEPEPQAENAFIGLEAHLKRRGLEIPGISTTTTPAQDPNFSGMEAYLARKAREKEAREKEMLEVQAKQEVPSELFSEIKGLPGVTPDQALEIYKDVYSEEMIFHKDPNNNC